MRALIARAVWKAECRLNRPLWSSAGRQSHVAYLPQGGSTDVLSPTDARATRKAELLIGITTYGRPAECAALVESLHRSVEAAGLLEVAFVAVVRDTCSHDYAPTLAALERCFPGRFAFYEGERWLGKPGRYRTYQVLFDCARSTGAAHALLLEDDVVVEHAFVSRALAAYESIRDPDKAVLYLAAFEDDEPEGRWVRFTRKDVQPGVRKTQWFDLHAFVAGRRFFETLHWRLLRPHRWRWVGNPQRSSGVSEQLTLRLWGRANVYQVRDTLAYHGRAPSKLNAAARSQRALDNFPKPEPASR